MARKTRKQKMRSAERHGVSTSPRKRRAKRVAVYKETEYDKKLRKYTIQDTVKTLVIIVALFVLQYVIVAYRGQL